VAEKHTCTNYLSHLQERDFAPVSQFHILGKRLAFGGADYISVGLEARRRELDCINTPRFSFPPYSDFQRARLLTLFLSLTAGRQLSQQVCIGLMAMSSPL
jgi:hypothetical protein